MAMHIGQLIGLIADHMDFELSELSLVVEDLIDDGSYLEQHGRSRPHRSATPQDAFIIVCAAVALDKLSSCDETSLAPAYAKDILDIHLHDKEPLEALVAGKPFQVLDGGRFESVVSIPAELSQEISKAIKTTSGLKVVR